MSFLRKITLSIFIFAMLLGVSPFFVKADSDQELVNFLETLITIGVIPSEKADLARTILNSALSDSSTRINRDLSKGSTGNDVKLLQKILNTNPSTVVASSGPGSSGNETTYFGSATEAAVIKFQNFYSFSPTGIVDGVTRAKVNALLSIVINADVPEAERPSVDLKVNGQDDNVQVGSGGTATILWTSANVTSCVSGTNAIKPTYGTESVTVVSYTQFEMTCVGPKGIVSDSVTVSVTNNAQAVVPQNLVILGNNSELSSTTVIIVTPPSTSTTSTTTTTTITKSLHVYVNGQQNYSTTTASTSSTFGLSWTSTGFTVCKFTSNPVITNPTDVPIPSTAVTAGSATITTSPNSAGVIAFSMACATGTTAINTLNQHPISTLYSSTNLMISTSTLSISNPSIPDDPATSTKSLSFYVNGQTNYSTTTASATTTSVVSWSSTGLLICKATSNPTISGFSEAMGYANGTTTVTTHFTSPGSTAYALTIACATGTATTSLENPVDTLVPSANLLIASSTLSITYSPSTTTSTSSITGPADVAKIVGYGPVNHWDSIDAESLASQLSLAGLTVAEVELNINPYDNNRKFSVAMPKLKAYITAMRAKNIVTFVDIINGKLNDEEGDYICQSLFTDQYYTDILDYINQNIGTSTVILQPVSEWVSGCHDKRDGWINIFKAKWTGMKSYYVGSHSSPPGTDWFKEYHAQNITDYGNSGELVNTDSGNVLNAIGQGGDGLAFADTAKLKAYACHVLLDGTKGFVYYGYGHTAIDSGAIIALGELKANMPTSCAALDEAATEEECDPGIVVDFSGVVEAVSKCADAVGYQTIIGPGNSTTGLGGNFSSNYTVANPACRDVNPYNTATALALYSYTDPGLTVGECVLGTANGNRDALCSSTTIACEGVENGNVRDAASDGGLMAAGVIQEIGADTCSITPNEQSPTSQTEDGGGGSNWDWCGGAWCYAIPGLNLVKFYDDIGSGFGLW
jgi:peptidoglycan hydrolase-like protein with peptidoglycan-binding domain